MSSGAKSREELVNIREERMGYCGRCGKEVYSVPIKVIKNLMGDRFNKEIHMVEMDQKRVKQSESIDRKFLYASLVMIPVIAVLLMLLWWLGLLLIGLIVVALISDYQHKSKLRGDMVGIRDNKIAELREEKQKVLDEFSKAEKDFENLCSVCDGGVKPR
jgi:hypothetical protein